MEEVRDALRRNGLWMTEKVRRFAAHAAEQCAKRLLRHQAELSFLVLVGELAATNTPMLSRYSDGDP